jgi:hypothetical protein
MSLFPLIAALGLLAGVYCIAVSAKRWQSGLHILLVIFFFGGMVGANLGSSAYPILFRDAFIVLPLYFGLLSRRSGQAAMGRLPVDLLLIFIFLLISVLLSAFNSIDESFLEIAIATKVWLFYIPFVVVGIALAEDRSRMLRFFRQFLFWGLPACAIGLAQSLLVRVFGYEQVMVWFFGSHAVDVTQSFTYFEEAGGVYRIPGTFSYVAQYSIFLHFYLAIAMIEVNFDPDPRIRRVAQYMVFVVVVAALLCGARESIIFIPLTLAFFAVYGLLGKRLLLAAPLGGIASFLVLWFSGLDLVSYFYWGEVLVGYYAGDFWGEAGRGLDYGLLGTGLGASSTSARYATGGITTGFANVDLGPAKAGLESYFAKAGSELGWIGFTVVVLLMVIIFLRASGAILRNWKRQDKIVVAPLAAMLLYAVVVSYKGKFLDVDPGNMLTWLFLGLVIGLNRRQERVVPYLAADQISMQQSSLM